MVFSQFISLNAAHRTNKILAQVLLTLLEGVVWQLIEAGA